MKAPRLLALKAPRLRLCGADPQQLATAYRRADRKTIFGRSAERLSAPEMLKRNAACWSQRVRNHKNGWRPRPSPIGPARVCVSAPIDRAAVRSVRAIERVTRSGRAGDWEAALIMRPAIASMGDRSDFLCVACADAVGKCALRERVAGDYCSHGQDRNSNLAHNASHLAKDLEKTIPTRRKRKTRKDAGITISQAA